MWLGEIFLYTLTSTCSLNKKNRIFPKMRTETTSKSTLYSGFENKTVLMESIVFQHELSYCGLYFLMERVGSWQNYVTFAF